MHARAVGLAIAGCLALATMHSGNTQSAPPNDDINRATNAIPSESPRLDAVSFRFEQSTDGATLETDEPQPCGTIGATVWFVYKPQSDGTLQFSTEGSDFRTAISVYALQGFVPSPPGGSLGLVASVCGTDEAPQPSLTERLSRGQAYAVQIGGVDGATGALDFSVSCAPRCIATNDDIVAYASVADLPFHDEPFTGEATLEDDEPLPCGNIGKTVWYLLDYQVQPAEPLTVEITALGGFPVVLAVYRPDEVNFSPPGNLDTTDCVIAEPGETAIVSLEIAPSEQVWVQAGGVDGAGGTIIVNMSCATLSQRCALIGRIDPPDSGGPITSPPGGPAPSPADISGPDTGSGGDAARRVGASG